MVYWPLFFFFKQKTAYEVRISDWSSDVCSSDLDGIEQGRGAPDPAGAADACRRARRPDAATAAWLLPRARRALRVTGRGRARPLLRSEERRVGQERVSTYRSRGSP